MGEAEERNEEGHELVSVFECASDGESEVIIALLQANGIEAMESSNVPHSIFPVLDDAHVLVNEADAERAKAVIAEHLQAQEDGGNES